MLCIFALTDGIWERAGWVFFTSSDVVISEKILLRMFSSVSSVFLQKEAVANEMMCTLLKFQTQLDMYNVCFMQVFLRNELLQFCKY